MADYTDLGLDSNLRPLNSPITHDRGFVPGYDFGARNDRGAVGAYNLGNSRHYITLWEGGASGGAQASAYTNSSTAQGVDASRVALSPGDFPGNKFYLEAIYRAGTQGFTPAYTFNMDIYDITGGSALANGTFTGTNQSQNSGYGVLPRGRSATDFKPSMIAGARDYMVRFWATSTSGTEFVDLYAARLIIDF